MFKRPFPALDEQLNRCRPGISPKRDKWIVVRTRTIRAIRDKFVDFGRHISKKKNGSFFFLVVKTTICRLLREGGGERTTTEYPKPSPPTRNIIEILFIRRCAV